MTTISRRSLSRSSRRSFSAKLYRKLQLLRQGYLLRELPDLERDRERYIVVEREANDLLPTIMDWWHAGNSVADLAELADDEARRLYNEGRGLRAYIWDEAASIMRGKLSDLGYVEEALAYRNRPRLHGLRQKLATGLSHGKRAFGARNPWYGDLSPRDLKPAERRAVEDAGYAHIF